MTRKVIFALLNNETDADSRVYPNAAPASVGDNPYIVYQEVGSGSIHASSGGRGVATVRVQISCFAPTYAVADDLLESVRMAIDGFKGTVAGVVVQHCLMIDGSKLDVPSVTPENELQTRYGRLADFNIFHEEEIPTL